MVHLRLHDAAQVQQAPGAWVQLLALEPVLQRGQQAMAALGPQAARQFVGVLAPFEVGIALATLGTQMQHHAVDHRRRELLHQVRNQGQAAWRRGVQVPHVGVAPFKPYQSAGCWPALHSPSTVTH